MKPCFSICVTIDKDDTIDSLLELLRHARIIHIERQDETQAELCIFAPSRTAEHPWAMNNAAHMRLKGLNATVRKELV